MCHRDRKIPSAWLRVCPMATAFQAKVAGSLAGDSMSPPREHKMLTPWQHEL